MTNEEAIKGLKSLVEIRRKYGDMQTMKDEIDCLDMAIKALEQEPVLDNIRAEIKAMSGDIETIADVLDILDKYRAESEE